MNDPYYLLTKPLGVTYVRHVIARNNKLTKESVMVQPKSGETITEALATVTNELRVDGV